MAVEVMDLKSSIIILQSELLELKTVILVLKDENLTLERQLAEKVLQLERAADTRDASADPLPESVDTSALDFAVQYDQALQAHFDGNHEEAIAKFRTLIDADADHQLTDNAAYWLAESYYSLQNYGRAIAAFETVFTYPQSNKNDHALLKIGLCYLHLNDRENASRAFTQLLDQYPDSDLADRVAEFTVMQEAP